ncbi:MAG: hypothetical protein IKO61_07710 [Lachnospiraceae bacterium]|nr:hypothetical protein [Lachnospiraceae bacterium]
MANRLACMHSFVSCNCLKIERGRVYWLTKQRKQVKLLADASGRGGRKE